jgi:purine nucleoside permease
MRATLFAARYNRFEKSPIVVAVAEAVGLFPAIRRLGPKGLVIPGLTSPRAHLPNPPQMRRFALKSIFLMIRNLLSYFLLIGLLTACQAPSPGSSAPIAIKVVVVSMFEQGADTGDRPGEFQTWVERLPLSDSLAFPQGYRQLRYNPDLGVLGMVTGIGTAKAAASIMALGMDPRFDLRQAYWVVAGIAGVDPQDASVGSAAWAEWLVDGDLSHEIDPREAPKDWSTGYIPLRKTEPYELPVPENNEGVLFRMNPGLVNWAYELTKDTELPDTEEMQLLRAQYEGFPQAQLPPFVLKGDQLAAATYWHGKLLNDWANDWVSYWTQGKGNFVTSAMEDTGTAQALQFLAAAGKVDDQRLLVLRTGSNYSMQHAGIDAYTSLAGEKLSGKGYSAFLPSLESAYLVGSRVVLELAQHWDQYQDHLPGQ